MLETVKLALRISNTAYDTEITDLIAACKKDLEISGVASTSIDETDTLIKRAIITYCKRDFGFDNPDYDKLDRAYNSLKNHLCLSSDYDGASS